MITRMFHHVVGVEPSMMFSENSGYNLNRFNCERKLTMLVV
jgi:hypothetical protein